MDNVKIDFRKFKLHYNICANLEFIIMYSDDINFTKTNLQYSYFDD